jgi:hypothetical protein
MFILQRNVKLRVFHTSSPLGILGMQALALGYTCGRYSLPVCNIVRQYFSERYPLYPSLIVCCEVDLPKARRQIPFPDFWFYYVATLKIPKILKVFSKHLPFTQRLWSLRRKGGAFMSPQVYACPGDGNCAVMISNHDQCKSGCLGLYTLLKLPELSGLGNNLKCKLVYWFS